MFRSTRPFTIDELGFIQVASTPILTAIVREELDLNRLAREVLANRGLDQHGHWVGFEQLRVIHDIQP